MLVHSDNVHAVGEDMETSTAQRIYHAVALEGRTPGLEILQGVLLRGKRKADRNLARPAFSLPSTLTGLLEVEAQLRVYARGVTKCVR